MENYSMKSLSLTCLLLLLFNLQSFPQSFYDQNIIPADKDTSAYLPLLKNKRVGLIVNQTSAINGKLLPDFLLQNHVHIVKIFVPEHGFRGNEDAGAKIDNSIDSITGLPIISLYGSHKKPDEKDISDIDVMVYDLQDVGVRFYTYISTLQYCMEACAENNKKFIVLDRPNPNGFYVDGPVLEPGNKSFVGMQSIPIVYGMTPGEYAGMLVGESCFAKPPALTVIKCKHYDHTKKYKLPVSPSPNLRNMASVYAYPSLCLFEGTKISVGRGTEKPFMQFGSPDLHNCYSFCFTPFSVPGAKNPLYKDKVCYGDSIISDPEKLVDYLDKKINLDWIIKAYKCYPNASDSFFNHFFIKLSGTEKLEQQIKNGCSGEVIRNTWKDDLIEFKKKRRKYLLYKDFEN